MRPLALAEKYMCVIVIRWVARRDVGSDKGTDGQTDGQTDRQTDRVRRNMRPPPREEGRITTQMSTGTGIRFGSSVSIQRWVVTRYCWLRVSL